MKKVIIGCIALLLSNLVYINAQKITITPSMVSSTSGVSNPGALADQQNLVPNNSASLPTGYCSGANCPSSGQNAWYTWFADEAFITFPSATTIQELYLFDGNGNSNPPLNPFTIDYLDGNGNWQLLGSSTLNQYLYWIPIAVPGGSISTTQLRFSKYDTSSPVWEVALYGGGVPNSAVSITVDPSSVKHDASSYIIGSQRNNVEDFVGYIDNGNYSGFYDDIINQYADIDPRFGNGKKLYRLGGSNVDGLANGLYGGGYHFQNEFGNTGPYANDDINYFIDEAQQLDADMIIGVNVGSGTVAEATALVQYFKDEGLLDDVAYFEMGNELMGYWQKGYQDGVSCNPTEYANYVVPFIDAMKAVDPNIKIAVCGAYVNSWDWPDCSGTGSYSMEQTLDTYFSIIGDRMDFIAYHAYMPWAVIQARSTECRTSQGGPFVTASDDYRAELFMAVTPWSIENRIETAQTLIETRRNAQGIQKEIKLVNTEYGTAVESSGDLTHSITEALYTADNMITSVNYDIPSAINFCLYHYGINTDFTDNIFFHPESTATKPAFSVHKMVAENLGNKVVEHTVDQNTDLVNVVLCNTGESYSYDKLSIATTKDADGSLRTMVVNRSEENVTLTINSTGSTVFNSSVIHSLAGTTFISQPTTINTSNLSSLSGIVIPKLSVNVIVSQANCVDNDNDNICAGIDCNDNNASIGAQQAQGTPCSVNNNGVIDGEIGSNGCSCEPTTSTCNDYTASCAGHITVHGCDDGIYATIAGSPVPQYIKVFDSSYNEVGFLCKHWGTACASGDTDLLSLPAGNYNVQIELSNSTCFVNSVVVGNARVAHSDINNLNLFIYPNPVENELNLSLGKVSEYSVNIQILDILGNIRLSQEIEEGAHNTIINTSGLTTGIYFLSAQSKDGERITKKFMLKR